MQPNSTDNSLYVKSVAGLTEQQKRLYEHRNYATAQDVFEEGMLAVPMNRSLQRYSDHRYAQNELWFVHDYDRRTAVLCERGGNGLREASLFMVGVVYKHGCMPFQTFRDLNRPEPYAPRGHQYIALTTLGSANGQHCKTALSNFHVMAGMAVRQNGLRPLRNDQVDGEDCIVVSLPFSTAPENVLPHETVIDIPETIDPRGILKAYVQNKGHVFTDRNMLTVNLAERTDAAGVYVLDEAPVDVLRQGQIVRVELAFRIVPAGFASVLRMDMKSVTILNADIAMDIAMTEASLKQKEMDAIRETIARSGPVDSPTTIQPPTTLRQASRTRKAGVVFEKPVNVKLSTPEPMETDKGPDTSESESEGVALPASVPL